MVMRSPETSARTASCTAGVVSASSEPESSTGIAASASCGDGIDAGVAADEVAGEVGDAAGDAEVNEGRDAGGDDEGAGSLPGNTSVMTAASGDSTAGSSAAALGCGSGARSTPPPRRRTTGGRLAPTESSTMTPGMVVGASAPSEAVRSGVAENGLTGRGPAAARTCAGVGIDPRGRGGFTERDTDASVRGAGRGGSGAAGRSSSSASSSDSSAGMRCSSGNASGPFAPRRRRRLARAATMPISE